MSESNNDSNRLQVGTVLRDIYRVENYISSGGFGNTYVATNTEFQEVVAIKEFFMAGVSSRDGDDTTVTVPVNDNQDLFYSQLEKFKKEARRLRKLENPHIVKVHDIFPANGTAYYVMDFIDGENISSMMKRLGRPLDEKEAMGYIYQVLDALDTVHKAGFYHLDLKPDNIMVDREGYVKVIDFGATKQDVSKGASTVASAVAFTNGYAPREQMEQNVDKFGPWTDFYALGATLLNILTNSKPPMPSDIDDDPTPDKHLTIQIPKTVSNKTKKLILWMMQTNRINRPQCINDIMEFLATEDPDDLKAAQEQQQLEQQQQAPEAAPETLQLPPAANAAPATPAQNGSGDETVLHPLSNQPQQKVNPAPKKGKKDKKNKNKDKQQIVAEAPETKIAGAPAAPATNLVGLDSAPNNNPPAEEAAGKVETKQPEPKQPVAPKTPIAPKKSNKTILIAAAVGAIVLIAGAVALFSGGKGDADEKAKMDAVATQPVQEKKNTAKGLKTYNKIGNFEYTGEVDANGQPDGMGEAKFDDGRYYKGKFSHGSFQDDKGFFQFANGDTYEGTFVDNFFGTGTYTVKENGDYFVGSFKDGNPEKGSWFNKGGIKVEDVGQVTDNTGLPDASNAQPATNQ